MSHHNLKALISPNWGFKCENLNEAYAIKYHDGNHKRFRSLRQPIGRIFQAGYYYKELGCVVIKLLKSPVQHVEYMEL